MPMCNVEPHTYMYICIAASPQLNCLLLFAIKEQQKHNFENKLKQIIKYGCNKFSFKFPLHCMCAFRTFIRCLKFLATVKCENYVVRRKCALKIMFMWLQSLLHFCYCAVCVLLNWYNSYINLLILTSIMHIPTTYTTKYGSVGLYWSKKKAEGRRSKTYFEIIKDYFIIDFNSVFLLFLCE